MFRNLVSKAPSSERRGWSENPLEIALLILADARNFLAADLGEHLPCESGAHPLSSSQRASLHEDSRSAGQREVFFGACTT